MQQNQALNLVITVVVLAEGREPPVPFEAMAATSDILREIDEWPVGVAAAAAITPDGSTLTHGPLDQALPIASITKPLFSYAVLVAVEEGTLALDQPAGPPGATLAHLLAHASGLGPDEPEPMAEPGTRRIYSNAGFELLGEALTAAAGMDAATYLHEAVLAPLAMTNTALQGSPAHAAISTAADLARFAQELLSPTLVAPVTLAQASQPQFADLAGVLPGFGRQAPNPWGLGFEIRGTKNPHWTGARSHPETFGHFGRAGGFLWVDPINHTAATLLTDTDFGPWAAETWPDFNDRLAEALTQPH